MELSDKNDLYDLNYLKKYADGDESFEKEIITMFVEQFPEMIRQMQEAQEKNDIEALYNIAHRAGSHMSFIRIHDIVSDIERIEEFSKTGKNLDDIPLLISNIETSAREVIPLLKEKVK